MQPGGYRVALRVGEPDPGDEPVPRTHGLRYEAGRHVDKPELGTAERLQRAVPGQVAPGQAEVTVVADAADERAAEVVAVICWSAAPRSCRRGLPGAEPPQALVEVPGLHKRLDPPQPLAAITVEGLARGAGVLPSRAVNNT